MNIIVQTLLRLNDLGYRSIRPVIFQQSAQQAHENLLRLLAAADESPLSVSAAGIIHNLVFQRRKIAVGGIRIPHPFILAAGFVKGLGFTSETEARRAVDSGVNIIPGWKSVPALLGLVEFGSFTRHPRTGNSGTVLWRDPQTRSTQNRIGLKNPGAAAAAAFLGNHLAELPHQFGINIAVSPGIDNLEEETRDVVESVTLFLQQGVVPSWFTLNLSCPNTEDDPSGHQTEEKTRHLCTAFQQAIQQAGYRVPLWVKISPGLAEHQHAILMNTFADCGVAAVVATNTIGMPVKNTDLTAGVGGGQLHRHALTTVQALIYARREHNYPVDIIGCGGITDGDSYLDFKALGVPVVQYWSALVYRGPLAPAIIESEIT